jgi:hypothetical protein
VRLGAAIIIAAVLAAVIAVAAVGDGAQRGAGPPSGGAPERVAPDTLLARAPHMGVSCRRPNSIACDRVGLAVWLREAASAVSAEIDGRRFRLDDPEWNGRPLSFVGYLRPAGLRDGELRVPARGNRWLGYGDVSARVRLWVTGGGRVRMTELDVPLRAGWG